MQQTQQQFWSEICEQKEHNKNAEWIFNIKNELHCFEEGHKVKEIIIPQSNSKESIRLLWNM